MNEIVSKNFVCLTAILYFYCRKNEKWTLTAIVFSLVILPLLFILYNFGFSSIVQTTTDSSREDHYLVFITTPLHYEEQSVLNNKYELNLGYYDSNPSVVRDKEEWLIKFSKVGYTCQSYQSPLIYVNYETITDRIKMKRNV